MNTLRGTNANGTFSRGNNIPAVAVPHGFNFWTPATDAGSNWLYSYQQGNNADNLPEIQAFSLSHEPSPWMGDRQTFQVMPSGSDNPSQNREKRALSFKHSNEVAKPDYYRVTFENGIKTEITPTNHAAMFRFTFTEDQSSLIFDNVNNDGGLTLNPDKQSIQGYTDVKSGLSTGATRMFVYATFDKPVADSGELTGEGRDNVGGYFGFQTSKGDRTVTMKIATSLIGMEQAKKNLKQEIHAKDTFASVKDRAQEEWKRKLRKIEVEGATEDELVTLYSNMYRLHLYPNKMYENVGTTEEPDYRYASAFSEAEGKSTATQTGAKIVKGKPYVNNGFWDTYRTAWPAYTLLSPKEAGEMIDGFVQQYRDGGWISRWSSPGYADLMTGTSADVAFADAYLKGVTNFDVQSFYKAAIKDASVVSPDSGTGRKGLSTSIFDGYTNTDTGQGMSWAMAGYLNDFAIANISKKLAEETGEDDTNQKQYNDNYKYYINRAQDYVNMFNPEVDFFMGRKSSGEWRETPDKYDPRDWGGDYTETNAWGMAFDAPHDGQGLANLYGGRKALAEKLDKFFSTPETAKHPEGYLIHEMREARDVRMGMYAHSNQPVHHVAYMYDYAGQPWKTQDKIREVLSRLYIGSEIGQGYAGDEDNGEMSAWYIFSAAGFYPLRMGTPSYAIGAPYFEKMTIHLENGKDIVIKAPHVSDKNKYIQSMKLNGKPYDKLTLDHQDIADGATLEFEMGPKPSKWGTGKDALPQSITPSSEDGAASVPEPLKDLTDHLIKEDKGIAKDSEEGDAKQLFDNTSKSRWSVKSRTPSIQYQFKEGKQKVQMYTLTSSQDGPASDPKSWVLKGSDDGKKWSVLDKRTDETFKWRNYTRPFHIENPDKYAYYKLEITDNGGSSATSLAEMELLGHQYETAPIIGFVPEQRIVVQPGSDTTFTWGVKNTTDKQKEVKWSVSTPKGLSVSPETGTLTVDGGKSETATLHLKASRDMAEGMYTVPVQLTSGTEKWPDMQLRIDVAKPGNLLPFFNNSGISKDTNPNANFDLVGYSYSNQALKEAEIIPGGTVSHGGVDFKWPNVQPNTPDNVLASGQTIALMGNGPILSFLGAASHGPSKGTGTIQYIDGTVQKFQLGFSDWTLNGDAKNPEKDNEIVASMPYRNSQSGQNNTKNYLFYTSVPLEADKMVESITLPDADTIDQGEIHIFSMSVKYSSPEDIADMKILIDRFENEGAFSNHGAAQALNMHLVAVERFAKKGEVEKVIKHLKGFHVLLDQQEKNELITKEAYNALKANTDYLIWKWQ
ncbi:GH92 family glycosyl hydrolase [Virgibacillus halophilus]|uniref:GH92 family glycosyl hydrolase n=1 Tax=Tigheibacillus halophilus TaxID=361280 RepID=A0ABU5C2G9_9BACI|nr:GH92 family glycosyl hydrolase [Virgibacillus halophilus]